MEAPRGDDGVPPIDNDFARFFHPQNMHCQLLDIRARGRNILKAVVGILHAIHDDDKDDDDYNDDVDDEDNDCDDDNDVNDYDR